MQATKFEFERRFWILCGIYAVGFWLSTVDDTHMIAALRHWLAPSIAPRSPDAEMFSRIVITVGAILVFLTAALRTWGTAYLRSDIVHDTAQHSEVLVADGPFRYTRNPLYLGNLPMAVGIGLLASRIGFLFLVAANWIFVYRLIFREEAALKQSQGESYRVYCRAVPRFWPSLRPRVPAGKGVPKWGQAFAGESFVWLFGAAELCLAVTLDLKVAGIVFVLGIVAHVFTARLVRVQPDGGSRPKVRQARSQKSKGPLSSLPAFSNSVNRVNPVSLNSVLIVGGGPAGMRAAEVASAAGASTILCDSQTSFGRKFLIAGRGGLNLTHSEPVENFPTRYGAEPERWVDLLKEFGPAQLREWVHSLGIETYVGSSGRVFPQGEKAAGILRAWLERLRKQSVELQTGARLAALERVEHGWRARFEDREFEAKAVVLALGGASWAETGSDGKWPAILARHGILITPWQPANCGWEVNWPQGFLERAEGKPLKNLTVRVGEGAVSGELLVTKYGLEGGAIYRLGPALRRMAEPMLVIDFKPQLSVENLRERAANLTGRAEWFRAWKLHPAVIALLETIDNSGDAGMGAPRQSGAATGLDRAIELVKKFRLRLQSPRPIDEAISSAGGVPWSELDEGLMLHKAPGVFVAGEMIDWEAPTGGYLLQGCLATGTRAGRNAASYEQNS